MNFRPYIVGLLLGLSLLLVPKTALTDTSGTTTGGTTTGGTTGGTTAGDTGGTGATQPNPADDLKAALKDAKEDGSGVFAAQLQAAIDRFGPDATPEQILAAVGEGNPSAAAYLKSYFNGQNAKAILDGAKGTQRATADAFRYGLDTAFKGLSGEGLKTAFNQRISQIAISNLPEDMKQALYAEVGAAVKASGNEYKINSTAIPTSITGSARGQLAASLGAGGVCLT